MTLVTGVMVTGKHPERQRFADAAIRSFEQQTWPDKQLIIVSDAPDAEDIYMGREFKCNTGVILVGHRTLGELRNAGLQSAAGEYVCQWDDDDWHHPNYISHMMQFAAPNKAVTLRSQIRYSFRSDAGYAYRRTGGHEGICGTVLHHNRPGLYYEAISRHEDCRFLNTHFGRALEVVDNRLDPELYLRFYHGNNTWDEDHIMLRHSDDKTGSRIMSIAACSYLNNVLETEYAECESL